MTARAVGISLRVLGAVRGVFEAGILMAMTAFAARELMLGWGMPTLLRLVACVVVGAAAFLPAYLWRERAGAANIRGIAGRVLAARRRPAARARLTGPPALASPLSPVERVRGVHAGEADDLLGPEAPQRPAAAPELLRGEVRRHGDRVQLAIQPMRRGLQALASHRIEPASKAARSIATG